MPALTVQPAEAGQRLDRYLRKALPGMPAGHIYKLLRKRKVRVNGRRARPDQLLLPGDMIILHMDQERFGQDTRSAPRRAAGMDFSVIFEDRHLLVVSKPPFLPVHPGAGHQENSLIDQIHAYLEVGEGPAGFRPALAHRLDRDTSGLLLVGKSVMVLQRLGLMLQAGEIDKSYLALARGVPNPRAGEWELAVQRRDLPGAPRPDRGRKDRVGRTRYRVACVRRLQAEGGPPLPISLLTLKLLTGRTHQIRSHLHQAGHPLLGDLRYGDRELNKLLKKRYNLRRQFLHAYRLRLLHPETGRPLDLCDPYPEDLGPLAESLRLGIPRD